MKHFLIDIQYLVPYEKISEYVSAHRLFLQSGYDSGILLMSGPKEPKTGGFIISRSESLEFLKEFFEKDPYKVNKVATYSFTEFNPIKYQKILEEWVIEEIST